MKLVTERGEIRTVASRWDNAYANWRGGKDESKLAISRKLHALDLETATRADVALAIGNDSWIDVTCDECKKNFAAVVHIGEEPDYEARWQRLCGSCLRKAQSLLRTAA